MNKPAALPGKWIDLLHAGDQHGRYQSRSEAVMAFTLAAVNHDWTWPDYHEALTDHRNTLARWTLWRPDGTHRTPRDQINRLRRTWHKAQRRVAEQPPVGDATSAAHRLGEITAAANTNDWHGAAGRRDKAIHAILCRIANERGTTSPRVSVRTLCEASAHRSPRTISAALHSLQTAGWLRIERAGHRTEASTYQLLLPRVAHEEGGANLHMSVSRTPCEVHVQKSATPGDMLARDLALVLRSTAGAEVYRALSSDEQVSAREVARVSGVHRRTVARWLPRLAELGLARRHGSGDGWMRGDTDPALVTLEGGILEVEERRAERHRLQREGFHAAFAGPRAPEVVGPVERVVPPEGDGWLWCGEFESWVHVPDEWLCTEGAVT